MKKRQKNIYFLLSMLSLSGLAYGMEIDSAQTKTFDHKRKIVIFTSKGGCGSLSASDSLAQFLAHDYHVTIVNPFEAIFHPFDCVKILTRGKLDGEDAYNYLLNKQCIRLINYLCRHIAPYIISLNFKRMEAQLRLFVLEERPDLIISVAPWINQPISRAAAACNIPFIISALDTSLSMWLFGMEPHDCAYSKMTTHEYLASQLSSLEQAGFIHHAVKPIGVPLRKSFYAPKDQQIIRSSFNIPHDKFVIMLMMGGAGAKNMEQYVKEILMIERPVHLVICVGRDTDLQERIESLIQEFSSVHVSCTVVGFTHRISDLMAISDLLITKTGPGSINEAICMQLPMLLDCTADVLSWEHPNIAFVTQCGLGHTITSLQGLGAMLTSYLLNQDLHQKTKKRLQEYHQPNFYAHFQMMVADQINQGLQKQRCDTAYAL